MLALIIDDDPISLLFMEELLSPYARIVAASSGSEAVALFRRALETGKPFDFVLSDIMMPEMDGHQTVEKIRGLEQQHGLTGDQGVHVIMISALDDAKHVNRAFFQGQALSYLTKPVSTAILLKELRKFGLIAETEVEAELGMERMYAPGDQPREKENASGGRGG